MNTLLEAIQKHPEAFIDTCTARASTTPSEANKYNHKLTVSLIRNKSWYNLSLHLRKQEYQQSLDGVVFCLSHYSYLEGDEWCKIVDLFNEGKIV